MNDPKEAIRKFVVDNFLFGQAGDLTDNSSLIEEGVMDSLGVLELVAFLQETFGIRVGDAELIPENLDTISGVATFVSRKKQRCVASQAS